MTEYTLLFETLSKTLTLNKARLTCLCCIILSLLKVQTVNFNRLSQGFSSSAKLESKLRRIQRFFSEFELDENAFSLLLLKMLPIQGKLQLSLDRTNWKFGQLNINILYLSVIYEGVGLPILWTVLGNKRGNSNEKEREELFNRFHHLFDLSIIEYITADREFIGGKWWDYLVHHKIPFYIRFRDNFDLTLKGGKVIKGHWILRTQKLNTPYFHPSIVTVNNVYVYFSGMKYYEKGELQFLMIASYNQVDQSFEIYKNRWQIETMFKAFKSSGFNLEDTHFTMIGLINSYISLLYHLYGLTIWVFFFTIMSRK